MADQEAHKFEALPKVAEIAGRLGFREGTEPYPTFRSRFLFTDSGIGDYICYASAIIWVAKNCPWIKGELYVNPPLIPLFTSYLRDFPSWKVLSGQKIELDLSQHFIAPGLIIEGQPVFQQYINPTGAHLIDLGFSYYAGQCPAPPEATYPFITQPKGRLPHELRGTKYAVFTPGSLTSSRRTLGKHINPLIDYTLSKGVTPVVIGRSNSDEMTDPFFPPDVHYEKCIDLRDRTTLLDAACVMEHAEFTLGLDNGMLHLAASTPGTVLFGYNIAGTKTRRPRRTWGRLFDITVSDEELSCISCQEKWKLLLNHSFHKCFYEDNRCIDLLFGDEGSRWKPAIDAALLPPEK